VALAQVRPQKPVEPDEYCCAHEAPPSFDMKIFPGLEL